MITALEMITIFKTDKFFKEAVIFLHYFIIFITIYNMWVMYNAILANNQFMFIIIYSLTAYNIIIFVYNLRYMKILRFLKYFEYVENDINIYR